jgi:polar amino acid transport system substrate-binding protein
MSCSYGPGRYDPEYEGKGQDYPVGYVRWTEKRNMQAFQALITEGDINIEYLTTHVFRLDEAPKAYDLILEKEEPYLGILISYDKNKEYRKNKVDIKTNVKSGMSARNHEPSAISIGFIGAGSYAQSHLLPNIPNDKGIVLKGVLTSTSTSSRSVADRYGFEFCTGDEDDILQDNGINTIFIATRHDSHGYYAKRALDAEKKVFVEKPLCLTQEELKKIELSTATNRFSFLMVGYNRRFSPLTAIIKEKMPKGPFSMIYRINAGMIPPDSWVQDKDIGGGRILGEVCHFVDYLTYINGSLPVTVFATIMDDSNHHYDTLTVSLRYQNGSVGSIQYFANGSKSLPKEYVEIYAHGMTAVLNDYKELKIFGKGKPYKKKLISQNKGQKNELKLFFDAITRGIKSPIPLNEIFLTSKVCFKIIESIRTGKNIKISTD